MYHNTGSLNRCMHSKLVKQGHILIFNDDLNQLKAHDPPIRHSSFPLELIRVKAKVLLKYVPNLRIYADTIHGVHEIVSKHG